MARPQKDTLTYFPLSVTFSSDAEKIRMYYGSAGVDLYLRLLCDIYANGYHLQTNEDYIHVTAYRMHMKENSVRQIINFLSTRNYFNIDLYKSKKVLTSKDIQLQYQCSMSGIGQKRGIAIDSSFWLLEKSDTESFIQLCPNESKSEKNPSFSENNSSKSEKNPLKEKETKQKEKKVNKTTSAPSGAKPADKSALESDFEKVWFVFPSSRRRDKKKCFDKFSKAIKQGISAELIYQKATVYIKSCTSEQYTQLTTTWFNRCGWEDECTPVVNNNAQVNYNSGIEGVDYL